MIIEQIYTGCLAHGAYYIESEGEAAIVDPLREVDPYIHRAQRHRATIKYVLETHFHADFVSGHLDLARKTGASIVFGPTAKPAFEHYGAADGERLKLGKVYIEVLHTPGHTMESSCFLLYDEHEKPVALFSGDTLFIGDVGRPDLAQKIDSRLTEEVLASHLFDSLRNKIMTLPDEVIVYPAHGAGSACGKMMSRETTDTLGHQKKVNYALNPNLTREEFIKEVLDGLTQPPGYFPKNVIMNIQGSESVDEVLKRGLRALSPKAFEVAASETEAIILDTRSAFQFAQGFIPNSINIGLEGSFAPWAGALIPDIQQPILIIAEPGKESQVITRLSRVGFDNVIGYLEGGFMAWQQSGMETDQVKTITADQLADIMKTEPGTNLLDVRRKSEFNSEHILNAENVPLDYINENMGSIDRGKTYYVYCGGGYRSMVFISILRARGFDNLVDVQGGFKALKEVHRFKLSQFLEPTSML